MSVMTKVQRVSVNHHLAYYDEKLCFEDIIERIAHDDHELITVDEKFDFLSPERLIASIYDLIEEIELNLFGR